MPNICLKCKGKNLCGKEYCPLLKSRYLFKIKELNQENFSSASPPSVFVGSKLPYPNVNVGILSPPENTENAWIYDAQKTWAENSLNIKDILNLRSSLINSRFRTNVYTIKTNNNLLELTQEIGMAVNPVDIEIELKQKVKFKLDFDKIHLPIGPSASLKNLKITQNPKIPPKVDKVYSDTDLKANEAIKYLYNNNFDEKTISQLLSIGSLGLKPNRKLVPTRFSITAADDSIGKNILNEIRDYKLISDYQLLYGNYLGNYYFILLLPEIWSYELFETYLPKVSWNITEKTQFTTDYESFEGRKNYAEQCAGGYYAARLPILEYLKKEKRQASVLTLRFITKDYFAHLGVFVCREAARKALKNKPINFTSLKEMIDYVSSFIQQKFNFNTDYLLSQSKLIKNIKNQTKLQKFFTLQDQ